MLLLGNNWIKNIVLNNNAINIVKCNDKTRWKRFKATDMRSAKDWHLYGIRTDGIQTIYPDGITPMEVYCDMTTDGGGWTVVADQDLYTQEAYQYPTANAGIPNLDPNDAKNTRLTRWPKYTEYAIKTVVDLNGAGMDDSLYPLFTKDNTGLFGEVDVDMMSFHLDRSNYQEGRASDEYVMFNGVPWGDSHSHASFSGYRWFDNQNIIYNWWGQKDVWGHLIDSDVKRIASTVIGFARTGSCGETWVRNDCRLAKSAWVNRATIKHKVVFMVR